MSYNQSGWKSSYHIWRNKRRAFNLTQNNEIRSDRYTQYNTKLEADDSMFAGDSGTKNEHEAGVYGT